MAPPRIPLEQRFWANVNKTGTCWLWTASFSGGGGDYGAIKPCGSRKPKRAHRISWELHFGPIPKGMYVLHHCDNPPCVNPSHLFLGTLKDNSQDMIQKGRKADSRGVLNAAAKLSDGAIKMIRLRRNHLKEPLSRIAADFAISEATVSRIARRLIWAHVP